MYVRSRIIIIWYVSVTRAPFLPFEFAILYKKMVFSPPPKPPPLAPPSFPDGYHLKAAKTTTTIQTTKKENKKNEKKSDDDESGRKNTNNNGEETNANETGGGIRRNELNATTIQTTTTTVLLDEETMRWRKERKKNYPRSTNKTEEEAASAKRKREEELERVLEEQRRLGSFEATVLLKEEEKEQKKNENENNSKNKSRTPRGEQPCKFWTRKGKCRYGDKCSFLHEEAKRGVGKSSKNDTNTNAKRHKCGGGEVPLLRRIFKNDIDRDNSRLLQSIRFFVENIDDLRKYAVAQERSEELNREYLKRLKMFSFVDDPVKRTKNSIVKKQVI